MEAAMEYFGLLGWPLVDKSARPALTKASPVFVRKENKYFPLGEVREDENYILPSEEDIPFFLFGWKEGDLGYYYSKAAECWIFLRVLKVHGMDYILFEDAWGTIYYFETHRVPVIFLAGS